MNQPSNGNGQLKAATNQKKDMWYRIAGAVALLTLGFILYRKKQTGIGNALMAGSINVLTGAAPQT